MANDFGRVGREENTTEFTRIFKPEFVSVVEAKDGPYVGVARRGERLDEEIAAHFKMDEHDVTVAQIEAQVLTPAREVLDPFAGQTLTNDRGRGAYRVPPGDLDRFKCAAEEGPLESPHDRFNFG
jgi:hypothetical protein